MNDGAGAVEVSLMKHLTVLLFCALCNKLSFVSVTDKFFKLTVGGNAREEDDDSAANDADQ